MIQAMGHHPLALGNVQAHTEQKHIPQIVYNSITNKDPIEGCSVESTSDEIG